MKTTRWFNKQDSERSLAMKNQHVEPASNHNSCGGCNSCHQMSGIHSMTGSQVFGGNGDGDERPGIQKPCATNFFQRNLGNSYMQPIIENRQALRPSISGNSVPTIQRKCSCGGSCSSCSGKEEELKGIQTKLTIGSPNDVYEQEADRVANNIVRLVPSSSNVNEPQSLNHFGKKSFIEYQSTDRIQMVEEEREIVSLPPEISLRLPPVEMVGEEVRMKPKAPVTRSSTETSNTLERETTDTVNQMISGGNHFKHPVKSLMQRTYDVDLDKVKIHTDSNANHACQLLGARAFTIGHNIAFAKGEYQPGTSRGHHLVAHELTHVIQQKGKGNTVVQRVGMSCDPGSALPYAGYSDPTHNCYAYALNNPSAGILAPGQLSTGSSYGGLDLWDKDTYTVGNTTSLTENDLGSRGSGCCSSDNDRLIQEVVTDNATRVDRKRVRGGFVPVPRVGAKYFDFHWYRQDADGFFSHKPGKDSTTRVDAGNNPISDPSLASRSYSIVDYRNDIGTWCI